MKNRTERTGDMGQGTKLGLMKDASGDVIVYVAKEEAAGGPMNVEFCISGTKSPNTERALQELFRAMEKDNELYPAGRPKLFQRKF